MITLTFRFAVSEEHLEGYKGGKEFLANIKYTIVKDIVEIESVQLSAECFLYIKDNASLLSEMYESAKEHASALIEEEKEFEKPEPEYNDQERQEERYL